MIKTMICMDGLHGAEYLIDIEKLSYIGRPVTSVIPGEDGYSFVEVTCIIDSQKAFLRFKSADQYEDNLFQLKEHWGVGL